MKKLSSTKLEPKFNSSKECHLLINAENTTLSDQWEESLHPPDEREINKVLNKNIKCLNGSGRKNPTVFDIFKDRREKLTANIGSDLGGMPLSETIGAGLCSASVGTDVRGTTPPRPSNKKIATQYKKKLGQKLPPISKELAKGDKTQDIRAVFEKMRRNDYGMESKVVLENGNLRPKRALPDLEIPLNSVRKLVGDYEDKIIEVAKIGHNIIKNPQKLKLKSDEVIKIRSPIEKKYASPKNKKFSQKKSIQIMKDLKALKSSNFRSPVQKSVKKDENVVNYRRGDIRMFLKGPEL